MTGKSRLRDIGTVVLATYSFAVCLAQQESTPILVLHAGKSPPTYHLGESIQLDLSFSAPGSGYCVSVSSTERVWSDGSEKFRVASTDHASISGDGIFDP